MEGEGGVFKDRRKKYNLNQQVHSTMDTRRYKTFIAGLFTLLLVFSASGMAFDTEEHRATLKGLTGVYAYVKISGADVEEMRLTQDLLQTDVELRLRMAGIKVLTLEEYRTTGAPLLWIGLSGSKAKSGVFVFAIEVQLLQDVFLGRNPTIRVNAATWSISGVGISGGMDDTEVKRSVREELSNQVDTFINAYLAANPK
jgi:hypothetical protein